MEKHVDATTIDIESNIESNVESNIESNVESNNKISNSIKYISEGVGWIGSILVLIPYVSPLDKTTDFILNTLGASGLFIVCLTSKQHQSVIINAAWIIGGIYKYYA
jgi:hypothetical protein